MQSWMMGMMSGASFVNYPVIVLVMSVLALIIFNLIRKYSSPTPNHNQPIIRNNSKPSNKNIYVRINGLDAYLKYLEDYLLNVSSDEKSDRLLFKEIRKKIESNKEKDMYVMKEALYDQLKELGEILENIKRDGVGNISISIRR